MSFDDLLQQYKKVEQEVKGTISSSSNSQNVAFVSSSSSTNKVNIAYGVSIANTQVSPTSTQVSTASTQWQLALAEQENKKVFQKFGRKLTINGSWTQLNMTSPKEFQQPEFEGYGPKTSKNISEDASNKVRESPGASLVEELVLDDKLEKKTAFPAKIEFAHCNYHLRERVVSGNNYARVNYNYFAKKAHPSAHRNMVPRADHPQQEDQGYVDSGCSRHMTGNMSYLSDFKEFDRGYVTFGGGAKGGKITGKGTLKTGKLDFEDVYFVKELQFNLFSVSQMCDKKNSVLFTDTACFVLSPDFKLADESQVLLKVPRKNNMYSVDMKNIVPKESNRMKVLVQESSNDEPQPSSDAGKKDDGVRKESGIDIQERPKNSTQDINTARLSINTASTNITNGSLNINSVHPIVTTARSNGYQTEPDMFSLGDNATLEATHANFFGDEITKYYKQHPQPHIHSFYSKY
ncbi:hypothetical protein Tco_0390513 [Tanacetum coccineum]